MTGLIKFSSLGRLAIYGGSLAAGALALQFMDYDRMVRARPGEVYLILVALAFLARRHAAANPCQRAYLAASSRLGSAG